MIAMMLSYEIKKSTSLNHLKKKQIISGKDEKISVTCNSKFEVVSSTTFLWCTQLMKPILSIIIIMYKEHKCSK
jgi:hypothetical protein